MFIDVKSDDLIIISRYSNLQSNQYKLVEPIIASIHDANFFFCNRGINIWNCLHNGIVTADTISCF